MKTWTPKEWIVCIITIIVGIVLVVPIVGATLGAMYHGVPVARPEVIEKATEVAIYLLGIVSGFVLKDAKPDQGNS